MIIGKWTPRSRLQRRNMKTRRVLVLGLADAEQREKAPLVRKIRRVYPLREESNGGSRFVQKPKQEKKRL